MEVVWSPAAQADLREIHDFIASDGRAAARAVAEQIIAAANGLAIHPLKGHMGPGATREWIVPRFRRYLLSYEVDGPSGIIHILRVWHQSRDRA